MTNWAAEAKKALAGGYQRHNQWEEKLRRHVRNYLPRLAKELGPALDDYLIVRVAHARRQMELLLTLGASPDDARTHALAELLPTPPDEASPTPPWETSGAVDGSLAGQINYLLSRWGNKPSPPPPPRTTRPT
jgi:hypothetical protein